KRAFEAATAAETMAAILREEPEPIAKWNPKAPAPLRWIVERCLQKDPDRRYSSTRDLANDLAAVPERTTETSGAGLVAPVTADSRSNRSRVLALTALACAAFLALTFLAGRAFGRVAPTPHFRQLTFRRGALGDSRFTPDGQTVVYSAAWDGKPVE